MTTAKAKGGLIRMNKKLGDTIKLLGNQDKIVTPRLTQFLLDHADGITYEPWVLDKVMASLSAPKRNRVGSFSASSAGECPRAQVFGYLGAPKRERLDVKLQNMGNDGTWRHVRYQANLLQAGIIEDIEFGLPWPKYRSMGSMDGVGTVWDKHPFPHWRGRPFILELKGAFSYKAMRIMVEGPETYLPQVKRYMLVSGIDLVSIVIEDRNTLEWVEFVYEGTPAWRAESREQLERLNRAIDTKTLPPRLVECNKLTGSTFSSCPYGGNRQSPCASSDRWYTK